MSTVISVEHLSKFYHLGQIGTGTFTNDLKLWWAKMRGKPNPLLRIGETDYGNRESEILWALRDVCFSVQRGEVLGIIGRNGAGKSTLLKILSRVTAPTSGKIKVRGRVASLLEVGTGFHPELTGRENIYLNGAILGMSSLEINRKFDEIVDFAEIEKFIDTPVKRYSSGMYVRLAFAVAAHLEPEILVVDEVLAVGDVAFQKKCLGKMGDVAKEGRTVLFVSHNFPQLRNLCGRGLWLGDGSVKYEGKIEYAIGNYQKSALQNPKSAVLAIDQIEQENEGFLSWKILGNDPLNAHNLFTTGLFQVEMVVNISQKVNMGGLFIILQSSEGIRVAGWFMPGVSLAPSRYRFIFEFPHLPVRSGVYYWNIAFWDGSRKVDAQILMPEFLVSTEDYGGLNEERGGILNIPCKFEVIPDR